MISFNKALEIIKNFININKKTEYISIENAFSRIIARDYKAKFNSPRTDKSAMDGIVILEKDFKKKKKFKIIGESKAGQNKSGEIKSGETKLIYTGAPVPGKNKKIIIIKEKCKFLNNTLVQISEKIEKQNFIRKKGFNFKRNDLCLKKNSCLNIRNISLASSLNLKKIKVFTKPRFAIFITGDEIKNIQNPKGTIYSSNSQILKNFINIFGGLVTEIKYAKDNEIDILKKYDALKDFDCLVSSGGISVGKYDLIKMALKKRNLKIKINTIAMKPGKPTTFGIFKKNKYFLGLPGNPVSCYVGSFFFIRMLISKFNDKNYNYIKFEDSINKEEIPENNHLTSIMRINIFEKNKQSYFTIYKNQDSSLETTLAKSNGLIIREPFSPKVSIGKKNQIIKFNDFQSNYF